MSAAQSSQLERTDEAVATHPDSTYFIELAHTYRRWGHRQRAARVLQRGLDHHPSCAEGFALLATVMTEEGRHEEARACWERVIELDPSNPDARQAVAPPPRPAPAVPEPARDPAPDPHQWPQEPPSMWASTPPNRLRSPAPPAVPEPATEPPRRDPSSHAPGSWWPPTDGHGRNGLAAPTGARPAEPIPAASRGESPPVAPRAEMSPTAPRAEMAPTAPRAEMAPTAPRAEMAPTAPRAEMSPTAPRAEMSPAAPRPEMSPAVPRPGMPSAAPRSDLPPHAPSGGPPAEMWTPAGMPPAALRSDIPRVASRAEPPPGPAFASPARAPAESESQAEPGASAAGDQPMVGAMALDLADLLVGLLEYPDPFFRGGTSLTRLLTEAVARELGLADGTIRLIALAAVLRDLGQLPLKGLISKVGSDLSDDGKRQVERHVQTAVKLLESVHLPETVRLTIRHHHERWDGSGYPDRLGGESIPMGARIVAVADTFAAMIAARPHRLPAGIPLVLEDMRKWAGTRYDPAVIDALMRVVAAPSRDGLGFGLRHHLIIVDDDDADAMVLAARLCMNGYLAETAYSAVGALERMNRSRVSGVVVSADLPAGEATRLLRAVRDSKRFGMVPIIMQDADAADRVSLLVSGADVCLPRGASFEEVKATFEAFLRRESRAASSAPAAATDGAWSGLHGDIEEFTLSWLLQVLNYDARDAAVFLVTAGDEGAIYLNRGNPVHAQTRSLVGEAAFHAMLKWTTGSFSVDPEARTEHVTITTRLMKLLLGQAVLDDHSEFFGAVRTDS